MFSKEEELFTHSFVSFRLSSSLKFFFEESEFLLRLPIITLFKFWVPIVLILEIQSDLIGLQEES